MTKKHFQALARALYEAQPLKPGPCSQIDFAKYASKVATWNACVKGVMDACSQSNGAFDRERFLEACETGTTRGMRK
jgi:hypothetical protein